jgi:hypothetical protein
MQQLPQPPPGLQDFLPNSTVPISLAALRCLVTHGPQDIILAANLTRHYQQNQFGMGGMGYAPQLGAPIWPRHE